LRNHAFLISDDAGKQRRVALQFADQIIAEFVLDRSAGDAVLGKRAIAKSAQSTG
jgi:hypothetical protein